MTDKPRILFVDDELNILQGLKRMLHSMSREWAMEFAQGGEAALVALGKNPIDIVVTDMRMPGMDGAELLAKVRESWPLATRIVLSGHSDHAGVIRSLNAAHQYLMKPCDADVLKKTVRRALNIRALVREPGLRGLVAKLNHIPSLPATYLEINKALASKECSARDVGEIVARDVGFSIKLLQLVNSAFFGLPRAVSTASEATMLLGVDLIRALVLGTQVFSAVEERNPPGNIQALMEHSLRTALFARRIANALKLDRKDVDAAFLAGFAHDIGRVVIAQNLPDEYTRVAELVASGQDERATEMQAFGTTHEAITAYILGTWGLPDAIVEAIACMHRPSESAALEIGPLTALHLAEFFEHEMHDSHGSKADLDIGYVQKLGLEPRLPELRAQLQNVEATGSKP